MTSPSYFKRVAALLACVSAGLAVAVVGSSLSGSTVWYLAVPAAVAVGWLFLADPTQCYPRPHGRADETPGTKAD